MALPHQAPSLSRFGEESISGGRITPALLGSCSSVLEENTRLQIQKVKSHPWISKDIPVRGFIYDVHTGEMHEVTASDGNAEAEKDFSFPL